MMMFYEWIYPIMLKVYRQIHKKQIRILTERTELPGGKIYMLNHSCRLDLPISACVIEKHVFWLVGKQSLEFVDRFGCWMNGAIWVDRKSKKDRKKSYKKMKRLLKNDKSILIFPEATWNLSDSVPMLPIYWGGIRLAMETGKPLVPLIMEYKSDDVYIRFGKPMYFKENEDKQKCADEVRDAMATLRWKIWEMFPVEKREEIDMEEWNKEVRRRVEEYPRLDYEYEMSCIRQR